MRVNGYRRGIHRGFGGRGDGNLLPDSDRDKLETQGCLVAQQDGDVRSFRSEVRGGDRNRIFAREQTRKQRFSVPISGCFLAPVAGQQFHHYGRTGDHRAGLISNGDLQPAVCRRDLRSDGRGHSSAHRQP